MHPHGKILIVDDDANSRDGLASLLVGQGCAVATASDGRQALEEFVRFQPDLVLLDVRMPNLDGLEVCRRLKAKAETRLTPVVLITAMGNTEDRVKGLEAGADEFLSKPLEIGVLQARIRSLLDLKAYTDELERAETVLFALARSIEGKDPYTEGHCERLADYSVRLAMHMGLPAEMVTALRRAGFVHDIGKVAVPDKILLKRKSLTAAERRVIQRHPVEGERICAPLKTFQHVLPIIRHHHEKLDGTGYPDGLRGEEIPLTARVLQVVDVFDALTTERSYKPALPASVALAQIQAEVAKGWWDPKVLKAFQDVLHAPRTPKKAGATRPLASRPPASTTISA